jgi:transposase
MFFAEGQIRVFVYGAPCDMRKSYDGLQAMTRHAMGLDPLDGALYVFINKRGTQVRVLYFDRSGFCIWSKRLEAGKFVSDWAQACTREMDWTELKLLLEGIEAGRQRKRYRLPKSLQKSSPDTSVHTSAPLQYADESKIARSTTERSGNGRTELG